MKRKPIVILLIILAFLWGVASEFPVLSGEESGLQENEIEVGKQKGEDEKRKSLMGKFPPKLEVEKWSNSKPLSLRKELQGKVVLLEFAFPIPDTVNYLMRCKSKYANQGFEIISFLNRSDERIQHFINGMSLNYIVVRDDDGVEGSESGQCGKTWKAYEIPQSVDPRFRAEEERNPLWKPFKGRIPTAFLIDRSGKVWWEGHTKELKEETIKEILKERPEAVLKKVEQHLKEGRNAARRKDYPKGIEFFQQVIAEADGTEYADDARKEIDGIKVIASALMKEARAIEAKGMKSEALKAYRMIARDFKGLVIAKQALASAIKLEVEMEQNGGKKP